MYALCLYRQFTKNSNSLYGSGIEPSRSLRHFARKSSSMSMDRVAAYVRVSTADQVDACGPDSQREKIRVWAEMEDVEPEQIDWYEDAASGGDTDRNGLQAMLGKLEDCEYDALVVYRADRLSRPLKDLMVLIEDVLDPCDTAFVSVTEPLDTTTPMGRAVLHMIGTFSELERGLITKRLREGRKPKARGEAMRPGKSPTATGSPPTASSNPIRTRLRSSSASLSCEARERASARLQIRSTLPACRRSGAATGMPRR